MLPPCPMSIRPFSPYNTMLNVNAFARAMSIFQDYLSLIVWHSFWTAQIGLDFEAGLKIVFGWKSIKFNLNQMHMVSLTQSPLPSLKN